MANKFFNNPQLKKTAQTLTPQPRDIDLPMPQKQGFFSKIYEGSKNLVSDAMFNLQESLSGDRLTETLGRFTASIDPSTPQGRAGATFAETAHDKISAKFSRDIAGAIQSGQDPFFVDSSSLSAEERNNIILSQQSAFEQKRVSGRAERITAVAERGADITDKRFGLAQEKFKELTQQFTRSLGFKVDDRVFLKEMLNLKIQADKDTAKLLLTSKDKSIEDNQKLAVKIMEDARLGFLSLWKGQITSADDMTKFGIDFNEAFEEFWFTSGIADTYMEALGLPIFKKIDEVETPKPLFPPATADSAKVNTTILLGSYE